MTTSILSIIGSLAGIALTYYLSNAVAKWLRGMRESQNRTEAAKAKEQAQAENQRANEEGDKLKEIDRG